LTLERPDQFDNPLPKQAEVDKILEDMQRRGVIEQSNSLWPSPVFIVWKENGDLCFCIDYRKLNDVTRKDCFPLPALTS
jgi:hypothetical protein